MTAEIPPQDHTEESSGALLPSDDLARQYQRFLDVLYIDRQKTLKYLVKRERVLSASYVAIVGATTLGGIATLTSLVTHINSLIVTAPLITTLLAALAMSLKQFQSQTYRRISGVARDARTEELVRGAIVALLESRQPVRYEELRRLIGALHVLRSDETVAEERPLSDAASPLPSSASGVAPDAWDPISVFLAG